MLHSLLGAVDLCESEEYGGLLTYDVTGWCSVGLLLAGLSHLLQHAWGDGGSPFCA